MKTTIERVHGRRVWDSRGRPTVEVEVATASGTIGRAIAPAGASTGSAEAVDLRDGGDAFAGYDVRKAVGSVENEIAAALAGMDARDQTSIDRRLIDLDGTANKGRLGGNALIATSMAIAHAAAAAEGVPLWRYLAGDDEPGLLPLPEIQIFGGGAHAGRRVDLQDFMVIATGAGDFATALDWTAEVYIAAGKLMAEAGKLQGVADEGGFWPAFDGNEDALDMLVRAIEKAGFSPGEDVSISLDIAATDFGRDGRYRLAREDRELSSEELSEMLLDWLGRYPIVAIEDPLGEDDDVGMTAFTARAGNQVEVVGDDFVTTNAARITEAASIGACNTALIKPNQIGTLTEARAALDAARAAGWESIVSARSGETEDVTIVHLAIGWGIKQLKVGSFTRSERMVKWNEGLRLADQLSSGGRLPPRSDFPWGR
ncbi:MAG: phosphopyruvate hydratase [Rhodospirillaceae bacterium]|mgnify:CR=1 FL=1|jgi:enolase|nr:phosphopyruvate hydratase [Rhodospirillaceae bacterium]MBT6136051.1 phosphopyruvate hydratase [Rhodospirillaceae bacterium]